MKKIVILFSLIAIAIVSLSLLFGQNKHRSQIESVETLQENTIKLNSHLFQDDYSGENMEECSDPMKYFFVFEDDSPERKAYAKELINFVESLQHDETTFDADLSAKLDKLRITHLT